MFKIVILSTLILLLYATGCKPGCTDVAALNHEFDAEKEDGSCIYSNAVFFGTTPARCPPVTVQVDGNSIGTIEAFYPNGPGNCSVPGVARFEFQSGESVDWVATDACGNIASGVARPSSTQECIRVRVF